MYHKYHVIASAKRAALARRATERTPNSSTQPSAGATNENLATALTPLLGALLGAIIIVVVALILGGQAGGFAALSAALLESQSAWFLSRASAFVAYLLLWWSMVLGISITSRLARVWPGGPTAGDLHEHAILLGIVFALLHGLVLLGDQYIGFTLPQILIPFTSSYLPLWVGLGQIGLYLMTLVTFSFYVRRWIGARTWRMIHYLSYAVFALALMHGITSGTDSSATWAIWIYASTGVSVLLLTVYRIWAQWRGASLQAPRLPVGRGGR